MKPNFAAVLFIFIPCLIGCKYIHPPFSKRIIEIKYDTVSTDEVKEVAGTIKNRTDSISIGIYFTSPKSSAIIRTKNQCITVNSVDGSDFSLAHIYVQLGRDHYELPLRKWKQFLRFLQ